MSRVGYSSRIFYVILLALTISACGPAVGNTFSSIGNSLPSDVEPTQELSGNVTSPTAVAIATSTALPNTGGPGGHPTQQPTALPAIPERRRLTLEFPPEIRAGDSDIVRLTLEVDKLGNLTPTAEFEGNVVTGEVIEIPNLYETHAVIAESRFDIAGLRVSPPDLVGQSLAPGQSVTFSWSILPEGVGIYRGTIWVYLRFVDRISGEESRKAVSAQPVEIEAVNFLSLSVTPARVFGVFGSIVGTVLGFPFLEDIVKFLIGRRKKK